MAPFKKRVFKKKRNFKKKLTLVKVEKQIKKLQHAPEIKVIDYSTSGFPASITGTPVTNFGSLITQGVTDNNRIGESIMLKRLSFSLRVFGNNTSAVASQRVRFIIFKANSENGVLPLKSDILQDTTATFQMISPYNWDQMHAQRFKILYDKTLLLCAGYSVNTATLPGAGYNPEGIFRGSISLNCKLQYNTAGGVLNHGIYAFAIGDSNTATNTLLQYYRFTFTDV